MLGRIFKSGLQFGGLTGFFFTVLISGYLAFGPSYSSGRTLGEVNGERVYWWLASAVLLAIVPLFSEKTRFIVGGLFLALATLSQPLYFIPAFFMLHTQRRR